MWVVFCIFIPNFSWETHFSEYNCYFLSFVTLWNLIVACLISKLWKCSLVPYISFMMFPAVLNIYGFVFCSTVFTNQHSRYIFSIKTRESYIIRTVQLTKKMQSLHSWNAFLSKSFAIWTKVCSWKNICPSFIRIFSLAQFIMYSALVAIRRQTVAWEDTRKRQ